MCCVPRLSEDSSVNINFLHQTKTARAPGGQLRLWELQPQCGHLHWVLQWLRHPHRGEDDLQQGGGQVSCYDDTWELYYHFDKTCSNRITFVRNEGRRYLFKTKEHPRHWENSYNAYNKADYHDMHSLIDKRHTNFQGDACYGDAGTYILSIVLWEREMLKIYMRIWTGCTSEF